MQQISCLTYVPNPCCFRKRRLIFNVHGADWLRFPKPPLHLVCPVITIQREPVSAVSSNINFPMKGRRGMKDWARNAEDKLYIPKEVFTAPAEGRRLLSARTDGCPKLFFFFIIFIEEVCLLELMLLVFYASPLISIFILIGRKKAFGSRTGRAHRLNQTVAARWLFLTGVAGVSPARLDTAESGICWVGGSLKYRGIARFIHP